MAQVQQHSESPTALPPGTVPVLIDDQKTKLPGFEMTRCVCLAIDCGGVEADWLVGQPLASRILLSEFSGIIIIPEGGGLFTSHEQIDPYFDQLERESDTGGFSWVVESEYS